MKYTLSISGRAFSFLGDCVALVDTGANQAVQSRLHAGHIDVGRWVESGTRWLVFQTDSGDWLRVTVPYKAALLPSGVVTEELLDCSVWMYARQDDLVQALQDRAGPSRGCSK